MNITKIQQALYKLGYLRQSEITGVLDLTTESALKKYQDDNGIVSDGTISNQTIIRLMKVQVTDDDLTPPVQTEPLQQPSFKEGEDARQPSFFNKAKDFRKNNSKITIEYGPNKTQKKTITNCMFRSLGQEISPSGEPLYEVIEFIGRDIQEE